MKNIELGEGAGDIAKYVLALAVAVPPGAALIVNHINERREEMCMALQQGEAPDSDKHSLLQTLIHRGATPENLPPYCRESGIDPSIECVTSGMREAAANGLKVSNATQTALNATTEVCER